MVYRRKGRAAPDSAIAAALRAKSCTSLTRCVRDTCFSASVLQCSTLLAVFPALPPGRDIQVYHTCGTILSFTEKESIQRKSAAQLPQGLQRLAGARLTLSYIYI